MTVTMRSSICVVNEKHEAKVEAEGSAKPLMDGWASLHQAMEAQSVSTVAGLGFDPQLLTSNFATAKLRAGNCAFSVM
ncbi:hypothetical protein D5086_026393 [Populus alba]|uniref:Uncharacterized protein n=1 Tax=Populus alba TaxID=43335 RepID=A0ACC4B1S2_POPAL